MLMEFNALMTMDAAQRTTIASSLPHTVESFGILRVMEAKAADKKAVARPDLSAIRNASGYEDVFIPLQATPSAWIHAIETGIFDSALLTGRNVRINVNEYLRTVSMRDVNYGLRYSSTRLWQSVRVSMEDSLLKDGQTFGRMPSNEAPPRTAYKDGKYRSKSVGPISTSLSVITPGPRSSSAPPFARKGVPNRLSGPTTNRRPASVQRLDDSVRGAPVPPRALPAFAQKTASTGPSHNQIQSQTTAAGMIVNPALAARRTNPPLYQHGITWEHWQTAMQNGQLHAFKNNRNKYLLENSYQSFKDDISRKVKQNAEYAKLAVFMITKYGPKNLAPSSSSARDAVPVP